MSTKRANRKFRGTREGLALWDRRNFRLGFVVSFLWFVSFGHPKEMNAVGRQAPQARRRGKEGQLNIPSYFRMGVGGGVKAV